MYQGLIESKLGSDFSPNTGYSTSSRKAVFFAVKEEDLPKVSEAIIAQCHKNGFEQKKIDGILHQLELALKHVSSPHF